MGKTYRSKTKMTYHDRSCYRQIHRSKTDKKYIMVHAKGGGTRRLYLNKQGNIPAGQRK